VLIIIRTTLPMSKEYVTRRFLELPSLGSRGIQIPELSPVLFKTPVYSSDKKRVSKICSTSN